MNKYVQIIKRRKTTKIQFFPLVAHTGIKSVIISVNLWYHLIFSFLENEPKVASSLTEAENWRASEWETMRWKGMASRGRSQVRWQTAKKPQRLTRTESKRSEYFRLPSKTKSYFYWNVSHSFSLFRLSASLTCAYCHMNSYSITNDVSFATLCII